MKSEQEIREELKGLKLSLENTKFDSQAKMIKFQIMCLEWVLGE